MISMIGTPEFRRVDHWAATLRRRLDHLGDLLGVGPKQPFFVILAVIGVSTKPGFITTARAPSGAS